MHMMRSMVFAFAFLSVATPALAQYAPGSIGNGGRMPETMSPGALPPPATITPSAPSVPATSLGSQYPNTQSLSRDRIESQGYNVQRITPQNNGSWKADVSRDPVPTRPQGVPSEVIIYPDGRIVEKH
jgi:hypothetical protein